MPIENVSRLASTLPATGAVTVTPDTAIVECDATAAGFTVTLYKINDGAKHELIVRILAADVSGNTVTITDGTFSTTLNASGAAVALQTDYNGNWFIAGQYPVTSSATASSSAASAGLAASNALSAGVSAGLAGSNALSAATSGSLNTSSAGSVATSQNASQSQNVSSAGSVATSQNASQSLNVSTAQSFALS